MMQISFKLRYDTHCDREVAGRLGWIPFKRGGWLGVRFSYTSEMEAAGAGPGEGAPSAPHRPSLPWKVWSQLLCLDVVAGFSLRRDGTINRPFFSWTPAAA